MDVKGQIVEVISSTLDVGKDELKDGQNLYDSIGVDSTEMVEVVVVLNKHFGIKIETNEVTKFTIIEEIVDIVNKKKQG